MVIAPFSISSVTLGKSLTPEPQFPYLQNEDTHSHLTKEEGKDLRDS